MIYLNPEIEKFLAGRDAFQVLDSIQGRTFRELEGRSTRRIEIEGRGYFLKMHRGIGWLEVFKNLLQFRAPVISAENEWQALQRLSALGVDTMVVAAYGRKGRNPARIHSFILTEELDGTSSLEDFCADWPDSPPSLQLKRALLARVAGISRAMHGAGICHRDFYLCHFLLHLNSLNRPETLRLSLIDLHRALHSNTLVSRWVEKDLAGLYFSSMDIGLTRNDRLRFVRHYSGKNLRDCLVNEARFWNRIAAKGQALYARLASPGKRQGSRV